MIKSIVLALNEPLVAMITSTNRLVLVNGYTLSENQVHWYIWNGKYMC
jgi:hypothetical protein